MLALPDRFGAPEFTVGWDHLSSLKRLAEGLEPAAPRLERFVPLVHGLKPVAKHGTPALRAESSPLDHRQQQTRGLTQTLTETTFSDHNKSLHSALEFTA